MTELIISEKPSAANRIAFALADGKPISHREGQVSYFELTHKGKKIYVGSAAGHLYGVDQKNKNYDYPIFDIEWLPTYKTNKSAGFTKKYIDVLKKLAKECTEFTVACDYDIEGEVIGLNCMRYSCGQKDANRMKFSTLTRQELIDSYANKSESIDWGQAKAGEARHFLDWIYGINLSRALMGAIKKAGTFKVMSTGRVQAPALKIVVDKEQEIRKFVPEDYWQLRLETKNPELIAYHKKDKFDDEVKVKLAKNNTSSPVKVENVDSTSKKVPPPFPFDLGTLQSEAYSAFGFSPKQTLQHAQKLYLEGVISYPRTSSQKLPAKIGYRKILEELSKTYPQAKQLIGRRPNEGKKEDPAHPSIFPTGNVPKKLDVYTTKIYDLVVKRFFAVFGDWAEREFLKIELESNSEAYIAKGSKTTKPGWFKLYSPYSKQKEEELPVVQVGQTLDISKLAIEKKQTQPPRRYTQASLVNELEKMSLGTKATRAEIVNTLFERGYLEGRSIQATDLGINTINTLQKFLPEIVDVELTREFEEEMELIRQHKSTEEKILEKARAQVTKLVDKFKERELEIGTELKNAYIETMRKDAELGICPKCGKKLMIKTSKKYRQRFVGCEGYPDCTVTYPLPQRGKIIATNKKCEVCGSPIIRIGRQTLCLNNNCPSKLQNDKKGHKMEGQTCPKCKKGKMVLRKSVYGEFLGCDRYPKCKNIIKIVPDKKDEKKEKEEKENSSSSKEE